MYLCGLLIVQLPCNWLCSDFPDVGPGKGLGCEICHTSFTRQVPMREHYKRKHRIYLTQPQQACRDKTRKRARKQKTTIKHEFESTIEVVKDVSSDDDSGQYCDNNPIEVNGHIVEVLDENMRNVHVAIVREPQYTCLSEVEKFGTTPDTSTMTYDASDPVTGAQLVTLNDTDQRIMQTFSGASGDLVSVVNSPGDLNKNLVSSQDNSVVGAGSMLVGALGVNEICCLNPDSHSLSGNLESNHDSLSVGTDTFQNTLSSAKGISVAQEKANPTIVLRNEISHHSNALNKPSGIRDSKILTLVSKEKDNVCEDFYFILMTNMHKGSSFSYGKHCFKCLHCDYKTCWKNTLCRHMKSSHEDIMKIHKCIETKSVITDENQKLVKLSEFLADYEFSRPRKSTPTKRVRGVEKQDLPGNYSCTKCKKVFSRLRYLKKHMAVHKVEQKYLCDECGKAFKTLTYLKSHRRVHKRECYRCSQCDFTSTINAAVHAHRQLHNDGSVLCDICGYAYTDKSTLSKHKKVHDLSRPFPCTFHGCTWRFKTEVMCKAHFKAHTTEGKFKCPHCGYVFRHKHHLQRHEEKMHGVQRTKLPSHKQETGEAPNAVSYIVAGEATDAPDQMGLTASQLVIATDADGNTVNYEVADIMTNISYQTLLQDQHLVEDPDSHTIYTYIPTEESEQIVLQEENAVETQILQD